MNEKSFFFYIHDDLNGDSNWKKIGVAMTPYSAVRARQKFCSKEFSLNHVYFGAPRDIGRLESKIKQALIYKSGKYLNNISSQTEMFKIPEEELLTTINNIITSSNLLITKCELEQPYSAANSGNCPFGIPSEQYSHSFLADKVFHKWGLDIRTMQINEFNSLFDVEESSEGKLWSIEENELV
jgi:hypothetical protein